MALSSLRLRENIVPQCIAILRDALNDSKDGVELSQTGDVWDFEIHDENAYIADDNVFNKDMQNLKQLKEARHYLSSLLSSLDAKVAGLEAKLTLASFKRGIIKLPNEILQYIFLDACDVADDCGPERLSQVCHRFRNVATSFPKLWNAVHSNMDVYALKKRISLSMELPLSISLIPFGGRFYTDSDDLVMGHGSAWDEFLEVTSPHCHRWQSLYIDAGDAAENITAFVEYPGFIVPSVESLEIIYPRCEEDGVFYEHIHGEWEFPNVIALRTKFLIPLTGCFNVMTECTLGAPHPGNMFCVDDIVQFLDSSPGLLRLSITDLGEPKISGTLFSVGERRRAHLPNLCFFSISNNNSRGFVHSVSREMHNILDFIDMPNVEEISVTLYYTQSETFEDPLGRLTISTYLKFSSLKRLSFTCAYSTGLHLYIPELLEEYPTLEILSLETPNHRLFAGARPIKCALNLHTLRLQNCQKLSHKDLQCIVDSIQQAGGSIGDIEIVGCQAVSAEYGRSLVNGR